MQRIQQLIDTARTRYHEASPRARITIGVCTLLVVFSALALTFGSTPRQLEPLLSHRELSNADLTKLTQHFKAAGLEGWELNNQQILIPPEQRSEYLAAIAGKFESHSYSSDVDSVLKNGSILDTPTLREMRLRNAREKDLARIITQIPGIEEAQINIDDHQQRGLSGRKEMTALAAIKAATKSEVTLETAEAIREVIAARFAGLERNNVVVIDLNTGHTFGASDSNYNASNLDIALRNYERWWRGRITNLLIDIPNARIEVGLYPVESPIATTSPTVNTVNATVSVGIPDSYIQQVAESRKAISQSQQQAISQQIKENVTELLQGIMPVIPHTTLNEFTVHVATILDLPPQTETAAVTVTGMLRDAWREILMGILISACVIGLLRRNRQLQTSTATAATVSDTLNANTNHSVPNSPQMEDPVFISQKNFSGTSVSRNVHIEKPPVIHDVSTETAAELTLKDELNALVDEAPADAADILKKWISSTSS